jgi:hypothetical protein
MTRRLIRDMMLTGNCNAEAFNHSRRECINHFFDVLGLTFKIRGLYLEESIIALVKEHHRGGAGLGEEAV